MRNDWHHAEGLWKSVRKTFRPFSCSALFVDDASPPPQQEEARRLAGWNPKHVRVLFQEKHQGIPGCLNTALEGLDREISLIVSADMKFQNPFLPWFILYAMVLRRADLFFFKCRHVDAADGHTTAITGWSSCRGIQKEEGRLERFLDGSMRPSGYAVAFRTSVLKKYRYDPSLGPKCDSYLNNLMVLKHRSFYWGKVGVRTLERPGSFSRGLDQAGHEKILSRILAKLGNDGIRLNEEQQRRFLETERSAFPG